MDIPANVLIPAAAGIIGALVGSIAPVTASLLQQRGEHRRERMRLAVQLAIEDHKSDLEFVRMNPERDFAIPPIAFNFAYHDGLLQLIASGKEITMKHIAAIKARARAVAPRPPDSQGPPL